MGEHLAALPHIFEMEDRQRARLVELYPKYVDVIGILFAFSTR